MVEKKQLDELASSIKCDSDRAEVVEVLINNIEAEVRYFKKSAETEKDKDKKEYSLILAEEAAMDLPFLVNVQRHLLR